MLLFERGLFKLQLEFRVSLVGTQQTAGVPPGTIIRQQPQGGFQVGPSVTVSLEVSP